MNTFPSILLFLTLISQSNGALVLHDDSFTPDIILRVTLSLVSLACVERQTVLVNGSVPGPAITMHENQTTWVRVYNDMTDKNLTMHWHGLSQSVAPFSDGTPLASQWPIPPGFFFDYEVRPQIGEAGTYFYHSHVAFQAVSAAGPLIVEELNGKAPFSYDEEKIFFVSELYNKTDEDIVQGLTSSTLVWSGETETILVNGKSLYPSNPTTMENSCTPEIFTVRPSSTYRFRFIGGTALSLVSLGIENHPNLRIIAADARYTNPFSVNHIQVDSGQRFDVLLKTKSVAELQRLNKSNFWIQLETRYRPTTVTAYALLKYIDCEPLSSNISSITLPLSAPLSLPQDIYNWLEYSLTPLVPNSFPAASEVTRQVFLTSAQFNGDSNWGIGNRTWYENYTKPYLVSIYERGAAAIPNYQNALKHGGWAPNFNAYSGRVGEVLEIILQNEPDGLSGGYDIHPWHIHGMHIYDIGSGKGAYNATENEEKLKNYSPVERDTTILYKYVPGDALKQTPYTVGGWRAWRVRVDNAGVWMVHCHTLQHMIMGMQSVWIMGNASEIRQKPYSEVEGYLTYGGSVYGNASYAPTVMHFFE